MISNLKFFLSDQDEFLYQMFF